MRWSSLDFIANGKNEINLVQTRDSYMIVIMIQKKSSKNVFQISYEGQIPLFNYGIVRVK